MYLKKETQTEDIQGHFFDSMSLNRIFLDMQAAKRASVARLQSIICAYGY
jgi:hypothetical protein